MPHRIREGFDCNNVPRPTDEPEGEQCKFCGKENDFWDDIGFFYIHPDPEVKEGRAVCQECYNGEPGEKQISRYGVGER